MLEGPESDLIQSTIGIFLNKELSDTYTKLQQAGAMIRSFPYTSPGIDVLQQQYNGLKPLVEQARQQSQAGNEIQAEIDVQILQPAVDKLFSDAENYVRQQQASGNVYYKAKPDRGSYFSPGQQEYFPAGSPPTIVRELKQYPVEGVGIPAWMWIMGIAAAGLWAFSRHRNPRGRRPARRRKNSRGRGR